MNVYEMDVGVEDNHLEIDYTDPRTSEPWEDLDDLEENIGRWATAKPPDISRLWSHDGLAANWDFVAYPGACGALSERLTFEFSKYSGDRFWFVPILLDNLPYYIPARKDPIDCLDRGRSDLHLLPSDPSRVIGIRRHAFYLEKIADPSTFSIPERRGGMFVTEQAKVRIESLQLSGVDFILRDSDE